MRRNVPEDPQPAARTADDVYRAYSLAMESVVIPKELPDHQLHKYLSEQSEAMSARWLQPHQDLLRRSGACAFERLPLRPLPDLSAWNDRSDLWRSEDVHLPSQLWTPESVFAVVRTVMAVRAHPIGPFTASKIFDQIAPPLLTRANADPDRPVLAEVELGAALIVALRVSAGRGYEIASVRYAEENR